MKPIHAHNTAGAAALAVFFAALWVGCDRTPEHNGDAAAAMKKEKAMPAKALEAPRIPAEPGKFGPSLARVVPEEHYDLDTHMETELCEDCHAQIVGEWKESPHAFGSLNNPFYRSAFDAFAEDAGREKSAFCAGCHDPALLFDGSIMARETDPDNPRAHKGVTCNTCHGIKEATIDGNGSYLLSTAPIPIPKEGDDHSLAKHRARLGNAVLRTNELCVSCHEGFLTPQTGQAVFPGFNEFTQYRRSEFAGNHTTRIDAGVEQAKCTDCHMPRTGPENLPSHRFIGGHSTLAATIGAPDQLEAVTKFVQSAATIDVPALGVGEVSLSSEVPEQLEPGQEIWADVVVYNENTGHTFPGGALDLRDTWIEVVVEDAGGNVVAQAGTDHEESGHDPSAVVLHAVLSSNEGDMVMGHRVRDFRTPVANHTIEARDALVSRYHWTVSEKAPKLPLTVKARLRHRRLHKPLHDSACEQSKKERGKGFIEASKKYSGYEVDPCRPQPVIEVGAAFAQIGGDEESKSPYPDWRRHWHRGLGLTHDVQENLPEAIEALEHALELQPDDAPNEERARILFSLGEVASRQGRVADAMEWWAKAEKLVGERAAIHFARGNAHQKTFRNEEALKWYQKAAKLVDDDRVWRQLAISAGSVGEARIAYDAARRGLLLEPRDPHLLRSQMLSLRKLEPQEEEWTKSASMAFSTYKRDEQAATIRDKCSEDNPMCHDEREPMRVTELR